MREKQNMTQYWIWSMLFVCTGLCVWGMMRQLILRTDSEQQWLATGYLLLLSLIPCLALLYFYKNKLYTNYDQEGITIEYFPYKRKAIRWNEIKKIELIELDAFTHSVWWDQEYGMVYHAKGNTLLKLETESEKLLIGTSLPKEIDQIVNTYYTPSHHKI